ncbi:MAG: Integral membrane protein MviN [candidate division TM6 bacterium GW2011_GWE2_42_60]|nr:MAG: Integral membrane protein MviN [candidate division TM6 bacterium GW2011_GWE2_42_60]HBY05816.1 murein biosynthesis integral membrane protein MurJ [Candidatus Dependentiae bacterium]
MAIRLTRGSIVKKTVQLGFITVASKVVGLVRETLMSRYMGVSAVSDAFHVAFRLPSSLRKIFAEGALSAAAVPTLTAVARKGGKEQVSKVLSLLFLVTQVFLMVGCIVASIFAVKVTHFFAPGWGSEVTEKSLMAARCFHILIFFIMTTSSGALLAGALQTANLFSVPIVTQVGTNILMVCELWLCWKYDLPIEVLAWCILFNSIAMLGLTVWYYFRVGFAFCRPDKESIVSMKQILYKFIPCAVGLGVLEINLIIDGQIASFLPVGAVTLLRQTYAFTRIPLGIFATTFASVLLPHFSRIGGYAPRRLSFYLFEATKLIWWVTVPATLLMITFSYKIFYTLVFAGRMTLENTQQLSILLSIFIVGLFFLSLDKIVLNMFYAQHETILPVFAALVSAVVNTALSLAFLSTLGLYGIVLSTVIATGVKIALCLWWLRRRFHFVYYGYALWAFLQKSVLQFACMAALLWALYMACYLLISFLPGPLALALLWKLWYWFWVGPLCLVVALVMYKTRRLFGIKLHFLD